MSDIKLKVRHVKRSGQKNIDVSGMGLSDIPADLMELMILEQINLSNNKL